MHHVVKIADEDGRLVVKTGLMQHLVERRQRLLGKRDERKVESWAIARWIAIEKLCERKEDNESNRKKERTKEREKGIGS